MIKLLKKFFNKQSKNPDLKDTLINEHKDLLLIYNKIEKSLSSNDFLTAQKELKNFIHNYNNHILLEDTELYKTLEEKYKNTKDILLHIKNLEEDMNIITKSILKLQTKYQIINDENKEQFIQDLENISSILMQRIKLEEERLYTLL